MLNLIKFTPLTLETHLVAASFAVIAFGISWVMADQKGMLFHAMSAISGLTSWYVFKVFDGITYDDQPTLISTLLGISIAGLIVLFHIM